MAHKNDNWFAEEDIAKDYAKYRPDYPPWVLQEILNYCNAKVKLSSNLCQSQVVKTEFYATAG